MDPTPTAYIDVRGPWPVYVRGIYAVELHGTFRTLTVAQAEHILQLGPQPF